MHEDINYFIDYADEVTTPLALQLSGISYCDGSYYIKRKQSKVLVIEYIEKGKGTVIFDGVQYSASEGDVYILRQDHAHEYFSSSDDPWVKIFFNLKGRLCEELLNVYSINDRVVIKGCHSLKPIFDELYELTCNHDKRSIDTVLSEFSLIYHKLVMELSRIVNPKDIHSGDVYKLKSYIDNNTDRIVSNEELARVAFRSCDYVVKKFKNTYGVTPYDYQISLKVSVAKRLLTDTALPVGTIAKKLGYNDQHYFSNLFRQKCGLSPLKYRKNKKQP